VSSNEKLTLTEGFGTYVPLNETEPSLPLNDCVELDGAVYPETAPQVIVYDPSGTEVYDPDVPDPEGEAGPEIDQDALAIFAETLILPRP
jgi:hypothetical protein